MYYLLDEANEGDGFQTWQIDDFLTVYRRNDGQPWVQAVNRPGPIKPHKFFSLNTSAMVYGRSAKQGAFFRHLNAQPWVVEFRPKSDSSCFSDKRATFWALPNSNIVGADGQLICRKIQHKRCALAPIWSDRT